MFPSSQRYQRSPMGSNYDRLSTSIIPRTRSASDAFGLDSRHQNTPNLRHRSSQNGPIQEDEPDYRAALGDTFFTPDMMRSESRPHSSGISPEENVVDPLALSNMVSTIGAQFGLTPRAISEVDKVLQQPNEQSRQIALICFLASQFPANRQSNSADQVTVTVGPPMVQPKGDLWKAEDRLRTFIRDLIKDLLMKSSIQAYSTSNSLRKHPIVESLENLVIEALMAVDCKVKANELPEGFRNSDLNAEGLVRKIVKEIAKTEKSKFQSALLDGINKPAVGSLVPKLYDLYFQLGRTRAPKSLTISNDVIWSTINLADKCRIALLSLYTPALSSVLKVPFSTSTPRTQPSHAAVQRIKPTDQYGTQLMSAWLGPETSPPGTKGLLQMDH
ncbi:uncharacterized protein MELLADRAFT_86222 [Melampsora larici-populina 98AG31]|uniref:Uncharacterized protein n=1 Tax=Melampsora larici-populina (strain 98AG31 / pathotype 3-4-7) TaxID=747676 RepID=F4RKZ6_MELLP|nr:uncharacterized protein MELLADRAFT_86222 [Melampsora larici-populina 98AG31]EGG06810.1 hypothetical protein MELLADRAFT_86222 [Melampsora larici-populina 98AG31]